VAQIGSNTVTGSGGIIQSGPKKAVFDQIIGPITLGFIGPKSEADEIKQEIKVFLAKELKLTMSEEKTLITHAKTENARFLGYAISVYHSNTKMKTYKYAGQTRRGRTVNGRIRLGVPLEVRNDYVKQYMQNGKPVGFYGLTTSSVPEIISYYQKRFRGIAEYYKLAQNRGALKKLSYVMQDSLVRTLAHKLGLSRRQVYEKYAAKRMAQGKEYRVLQTTVTTQNGKNYTYYWGAIPLAVCRYLEPIEDQKQFYFRSRTDLIQRLEAKKCEVCGRETRCEVHHVKRLADLKERWRGQTIPRWALCMMARNRKTLVVCLECHKQIHRDK
jgi:hypothetical protein